MNENIPKGIDKNSSFVEALQMQCGSVKLPPVLTARYLQERYATVGQFLNGSPEDLPSYAIRNRGWLENFLSFLCNELNCVAPKAWDDLVQEKNARRSNIEITKKRQAMLDDSTPLVDMAKSTRLTPRMVKVLAGLDEPIHTLGDLRMATVENISKLPEPMLLSVVRILNNLDKSLANGR